MPFGELTPLPRKYYFDVSFEKKDDAKKLGAWFDWDKKCWYAPNQIVAEALANNNFTPKKIKKVKELSGLFKGLVCNPNV